MLDVESAGLFSTLKASPPENQQLRGRLACASKQRSSSPACATDRASRATSKCSRPQRTGQIAVARSRQARLTFSVNLTRAKRRLDGELGTVTPAVQCSICPAAPVRALFVTSGPVTAARRPQPRQNPAVQGERGIYGSKAHRSAGRFGARVPRQP